MAHWRAVLPREQLIEIDYEKLVQDPALELRRLLEFAGLSWDARCLAPERNPRILKTASQWQARQPVHNKAVDRWRRYEPWLGELRSLVKEGHDAR